ncbi:hypothetical protein Nwi_1019 [Nitrobacter winogradskyi Nb-255]|uniref:Uncharacterized protein n=1 Tax=Nitrobacter winogradskyi (strain ATCC 25391 / DSM 10237 / CIP 104748 / NCIMB 11846 / Nb-255) TaxID=323098 RepID=Q3STW0_NITWN|nr:hypothetical protein Nwi_1019 [Nitrobacter winogradskyi Nb-255]
MESGEPRPTRFNPRDREWFLSQKSRPTRSGLSYGTGNALSGAAAVTDFFLPLRFPGRIIFLYGIPNFGLSPPLILRLLHLRPAAAVLLLSAIFFVYRSLTRISRIWIRRVGGTRIAGRTQVIGSRRRMATLRILMHIFTDTGPRFTIIAHRMRSFADCDDLNNSSASPSFLMQHD